MFRVKRFFMSQFRYILFEFHLKNFAQFVAITRVRSLQFKSINYLINNRLFFSYFNQKHSYSSIVKSV